MGSCWPKANNKKMKSNLKEVANNKSSLDAHPRDETVEQNNQFDTQNQQLQQQTQEISQVQQPSSSKVKGITTSYEENGEENNEGKKSNSKLSARRKRANLQMENDPTPKKQNQELNSKSILDNSAQKGDTDRLVDSEQVIASARGSYDPRAQHPWLRDLEKAIGSESVNAIQSQLTKISKAKLLSDKKKLEEELVEKYLAENATKRCVLEYSWAEQYMAYVNGKTKVVFDKPISNDRLISQNTGELIEDLIEGKDFVLVTNKVWYIFYRMYGGGPLKQYNSELPTKKTQIEPIGLKNNSNFCYMNACIQTMFSIGELNTYFAEKRYSKYKGLDTKKPLNFSFAYWNLLRLFYQAQESNKSIVSAVDFQNQSRNQFDPYEQHDAQEYLRFVLGEIQDELSLKQRPPSKSEFSDSQAAWESYFSQNTSVIDQLFCGQLISSITCEKCKAVSKTYEPFLDLSLPVDIKSINHIDGLIAAFFQPEKIDGMFTCEKCKKQSSIVRRFEIGRLPQYLVFHFKRFKMFPATQKIKTDIEYPKNLSNIKKYLFDKKENNSNYRLMSVIIHSGSVEYGHYVSFNLRGDQWWYCDDETIKPVEEEDALGNEAYLLFYERIV